KTGFCFIHYPANGNESRLEANGSTSKRAKRSAYAQKNATDTRRQELQVELEKHKSHSHLRHCAHECVMQSIPIGKCGPDPRCQGASNRGTGLNCRSCDF